jgi:hypothetical protein
MQTQIDDIRIYISLTQASDLGELVVNVLSHNAAWLKIQIRNLNKMITSVNISGFNVPLSPMDEGNLKGVSVDTFVRYNFYEAET